MPVVGVTRLHIHSILRAPRFFWHIRKTARQARGAPGFLGGRLANEGLTGFWTITVWIDEAAMRDYLRARPHRAAMPRLRVWCDEASVVHWQQDTGELPTAAEALDHMVNQGRPSKVDRPSQAQRGGRLAPSGRAPEFGPVLTSHSHAGPAADPR
jgi:uncharacterized protein DUF3291